MVLTLVASTQHRHEKQAMWVTVVAWRKLAEQVATSVKKGTLVPVIGRLSIRKYTDKTSVERTAVEIIAYDVRFLEPKEKQPEEDPLEPEQAA
jgi:single-strand DNA-binding protein